MSDDNNPQENNEINEKRASIKKDKIISKNKVSLDDRDEKDDYGDQIKCAKKELEAKRLEERNKKIHSEQEAKQMEINKKWELPFATAKKSGVLIVNRGQVDHIISDVYNIAASLNVLRLDGNSISLFPSKLCTAMSSLTVLGLSDCSLTELPDEITTIVTLQRLNIMKNKIVELPDNIGNLINLEELHLSDNKLEKLPESMQTLQKIPTLNLEKNCLTEVSNQIGNMKFASINICQNNLERLPDFIQHCTQYLTSITADNNKIRRIPPGIGNLKLLKHLSLCRNEIHIVPESLCDCLNLEDLWLDWNSIERLPTDFLRLEKLKSLRLVGNSLIMPTNDIVELGIREIRRWYEKNIATIIQRDRKRCVVELESLLATMYQEGKLLRQFFEPGLPRDGSNEFEGLYFAVVESYLFDEVIPQWNEYITKLSNEELETKIAHYRATNLEADKEIAEKFEQSCSALEQEEKYEEDEELVLGSEEHDEIARLELYQIRRSWEPFTYSREATKLALFDLRDSFGNVAYETDHAWFRRCRCQDGKRICVPPNANYRCERIAWLIKMNLVTFAEQIKRNSFEKERQTLKKRLSKRIRELDTYFGKRSTKDQFRKMAQDEATKIMLEAQQKVFCDSKKATLVTEKEQQDRKRKKQTKKLETAVKVAMEKLRAERRKLLANLEQLEGWEAEETEQMILILDEEMNNLPQKMELDILKSKIEEENEMYEIMLEPEELLVDFKQKKFDKAEYNNMMMKIEKNLIETFRHVELSKIIRDTRREFRISRRIVMRWTMLNVKMVFGKWKAWVDKKIFWRRRDEENTRQMNELQAENDQVSSLYIGLELQKWTKHVDPYSDQVYWQHCETGEISKEDPSTFKNDYIPRIIVQSNE